MPATPWKRLAEVDPEREYLALLTYLPLTRYRNIPHLVRTTRTVVKQLEGSGGVFGYSLLAKLPSKRFWTLSVWEDSAALARFARSQPHRDVMRTYGARLSGFETLRWQIPGAAVPPSWQDARSRQRSGAENGRSAG